MKLDEHLRVVPELAERLDNPDPMTYVVTLRRGVRFHDGHELTSADVVYTFRSLLDPAFVSPRKGAFRDAAVGRRARSLHGRVHAEGAVRVVSDQPRDAGSCRTAPGRRFASIRSAPGPYRFVRYAVDDRLELARVRRLLRRPPDATTASCCKIVPDDIMRGLELRKGTMDLVVNDLAPDIVHQLEQRADVCRRVEAPGVDYQYIGLNLRDPILQDVRVRQALALRDRSPGDRRLPAPRPGDAGRRACCRRCRGRSRRTCFAFRYDPGEGARAARRGRLSRSGRRRPAPRLAPDAEGVEHRVQPAAVGGHSAEPARGRHRRSTSAPTSSRRCTPTC